MKFKDTQYRISVVLNDKDKKGLLVIIKEVIVLWVIKKRFPKHYFGRFLYRKNSGPYKNFLDNTEYNKIIRSKELNPQEYAPLVNNKLIFATFCERLNIPSPKVLGYNFKTDFFYNGTVQRITEIAQMVEYFEKLYSSTGLEKVFIKSLNGLGGKETHLLERSTMVGTLKELGSTFLNQAFIHQACIEQHPAISKIYPGSVNTLRLETYVDKNNKPGFLGAIIRFGAGGSPIDNISSGGFFVIADLDTGILSERGMQALLYGGKTLPEHPDTGFIFKGFKLPYFEESKALCLKLVRYLPSRLVGWDIAITPAGPVVIEGNVSPGINIGEIGYGGYVKHPIYKEIFAKKGVF